MVKQKRNDKYTVKQVSQAIREARGVKAAAGRILGCAWETVDYYIKRYPKCQEAYEESVKQVTDFARGNLIRAIYSGDLAESKWWLSRKDPEFTDVSRTELTGKDGGPIQVDDAREKLFNRVQLIAERQKQLAENRN